MKDILILIAAILASMILLVFILGTVWVFFFAMAIGNTLATLIILAVGIAFAINIYLYCKEELWKGED